MFKNFADSELDRLKTGSNPSWNPSWNPSSSQAGGQPTPTHTSPALTDWERSRLHRQSPSSAAKKTGHANGSSKSTWYRSRSGTNEDNVPYERSTPEKSALIRNQSPTRSSRSLKKEVKAPPDWYLKRMQTTPSRRDQIDDASRRRFSPPPPRRGCTTVKIQGHDDTLTTSSEVVISDSRTVTFQDLDLNKDGVITKEEWEAAANDRERVESQTQDRRKAREIIQEAMATRPASARKSPAGQRASPHYGKYYV